MKKHFLDNFNDVQIWILQDQYGKIVGKILWKFTQGGKTCKCGMFLNTGTFKINFTTIGTTSGGGYEHTSAAYADLMRRLEIKCEDVCCVGSSAIKRHLKEQFDVTAFELI